MTSGNDSTHDPIKALWDGTPRPARWIAGLVLAAGATAEIVHSTREADKENAARVTYKTALVQDIQTRLASDILDAGTPGGFKAAGAVARFGSASETRVSAPQSEAVADPSTRGVILNGEEPNTTLAGAAVQTASDRLEGNHLATAGQYARVIYEADKAALTGFRIAQIRPDALGSTPFRNLNALIELDQGLKAAEKLDKEATAGSGHTGLYVGPANNGSYVIPTELGDLPRKWSSVPGPVSNHF